MKAADLYTDSLLACNGAIDTMPFCWVHLKLLQGALLARGLHKSIHGLPLTVLNTPQLPHSCACMDLLPLCLGAIILYGLQHGTTLKMVFMAILPLGREL